MIQMLKNKVTLLRIILCSTFIAQFLFTFPAWYPDGNLYPRIPALAFLPIHLPLALQAVLFGVMLFSLLMICFDRYSKIALAVFTVVLGIYFLDNVNRIQPWLFLHVGMLHALIYSKENGLNFLRWCMVFMYFWSGIHKLNLNFAWEVFPYLMNPFGLRQILLLPPGDIGNYAMPAMNHLAWIIPVLEIFTAVGLLFSKTRFIAVICALITHFIILIILGPFGLSWNEVVWFWNVELVVLVLILFHKIEQPLFRSSILFGNIKRFAFTFVMGIAPLLWYFVPYPHMLSYHLYSGYNPQINFWFKGVNTEILDSKWAGFTFYDVEKNESFIMVDHYGMKEQGMPVFTEEYYFKLTGKKLCDCFGYSNEDAGILIESRTKFYAQIKKERITCKDLLSK